MKCIASDLLGRTGRCRGIRHDREVWSRAICCVAILSVGALFAGCAGSTSSPRKLANKSAGSSSYDRKLGVSTSPRIVAHQSSGRRRTNALSRELPGARVPKGGGNYKLGKPYKIGGRWYVPKLVPNYNKTGMASWYGDDFHGRKTANGEIYDMNSLTAAHPTMPLPSYAYVTNLSNGRTVMVRVNDRGPYAHGRVIDMSRAAAEALDYKGKGLARVRVRYAGRAPLNGADTRERRFLASQSWYRGSGRRSRGRYASRPAGGARAARGSIPRSPRRNATQSRSLAQSQSSGRTPTWNWRPGRAAPAVPTARYAASQPAPAGYGQSRPPRYGLGRTTPATGSVSVRAGTFMVQANAERMASRLAGLGRIVIDPVQLSRGTGYRVSVGPVPARNGGILRASMVSRGVAAPLIVRQ